MAEPIRKAYGVRNIEPFYVGATSAAFTEDGSIVATPLNEDVVITDLSTNTTLHTLEGDGELVTALAMTPNGSRLAVVSQSQQLRVYNVETGEITKQYRFQAPVYIARADETSTLFAFGATDGVVTVWDVEGGYVTHSLKGHGTTICSLCFHGELHSSKWMLALGDTMGTSKVWDLVKRKCISTHQEHTGAVRGLAFSPDGSQFITGGRDAIVVIYNTENLKKVINTVTVRHQVECCGFIQLPLGELVFYTAGSENQVKLWDISSGKPLGGSPKPLETTEELMALEVIHTNDDTHLWMVVSDQTLVEMSLEDMLVEDGAAVIPITRRVAGNHGIIADLRYAGPDHNLVAMATNAPALRVVDFQNAPLDVQLYEGHTDLLNCIDVSEDGRWILTGSKDNLARLWAWDEDEHTFSQYAVFTGHAGAVSGCALPKNIDQIPRFIVTASTDLTVKKWKVPKEAGSTVKTSEYTRRAHDKDINALAISPNDEYFATASFDKLGKVWDLTSGETVGVLKGHKRGLWDIGFCQYDKLITTGSGDKTARIWLLTDFTCMKTLEGHTNAVQRSRFINKNKQLMTTGADGLVKLWDIKESECVATLDNHDNRIWAADVKEDGLQMITADADGHLSLWNDRTDELLQEEEEKKKEKVEQEQQLSNYINKNDWNNAFLLALTLEHLMRLYNVVKAAIGANEDPELAVGSKSLEQMMMSLESEQMEALLKRVRDWNINFKQFEIAQKVLTVIVSKLDMERGNIRKMVEQIIPYNERHYQRLDELVEQTYVLDYVVQEMEKA